MWSSSRFKYGDATVEAPYIDRESHPCVDRSSVLRLRFQYVRSAGAFEKRKSILRQGSFIESINYYALTVGPISSQILARYKRSAFQGRHVTRRERRIRKPFEGGPPEETFPHDGI